MSIIQSVEPHPESKTTILFSRCSPTGAAKIILQNKNKNKNKNKKKKKKKKKRGEKKIPTKVAKVIHLSICYSYPIKNILEKKVLIINVS
jgi:hypothetical protein